MTLEQRLSEIEKRCEGDNFNPSSIYIPALLRMLRKAIEQRDQEINHYELLARGADGFPLVRIRKDNEEILKAGEGL
jgi:hypothetical protein